MKPFGATEGGASVKTQLSDLKLKGPKAEARRVMCTTVKIDRMLQKMALTWKTISLETAT